MSELKVGIHSFLPNEGFHACVWLLLQPHARRLGMFRTPKKSQCLYEECWNLNDILLKMRKEMHLLKFAEEL